MRAAVELAPDLAFTKAALAHALARNGDTLEARGILTQLLSRERQGYIAAYELAIIYAGLGETDSAFASLAKALIERSMFVVHLGWDARLQPLRGDGRFRELVGRLALPRRDAPVRSSKTAASP